MGISYKFKVYLLHGNSDEILKDLGEYIYLFPPNIGDWITADFGFELDSAEVIYFRHDMCVSPVRRGLGLEEQPSASMFVRRVIFKSNKVID